MILDLGSSTRRELMVDHVYPAETWGRGGHTGVNKMDTAKTSQSQKLKEKMETLKEVVLWRVIRVEKIKVWDWG